LALLLDFAAAPAAAQDLRQMWPQWRGPTRDSRYHGEPWPDSIAGDRIAPLWRVEGLGPSYSGAIVTDALVYTTATVEARDEVVTAHDRKTGERRWEARWPGSMTVKPVGAAAGDWIKATPAYDGRSLYVAGMRDVLVCLDAATGEERWRVDFMERYNNPIPELGFICSPMVIGDSVYVQAADSLVCVDKETGESRWRVLIRDALGHGAYSSPEFAVFHGRPQVLVATIPAIHGVDPVTGEILWRAEIDSQVAGCVLAPIPYRDSIFTSSRASRTGLYKVEMNGPEGSIVTKTWSNRVTIYLSNPVIVGDYAYAHLRNRRMTCIDLRTGEDKWITPPDYDDYMSTIVQGDRLLTLSNAGVLRLIRANPEEFELLESRAMSEDAQTWGHLALAGREMFIREQDALAAYVWR
jgi:outer membrane protein assembly factor BamB